MNLTPEDLPTVRLFWFTLGVLIGIGATILVFSWILLAHEPSDDD